MDTGLIDNPTRKKILLALKKNGSMSVDDLSDEVKITPMGVRQHLLILERKGAVEYITRKHGVGRPGFLYRLTETADDLFPKSYQTFAMDILTELERLDGKGKIDEIFRRRKERIASEIRRLLSGKETVSERLHALSDLLQRDGFIVDLEENATSFKLKQFNCPISKVALRFKEACTHDLQLFREIIGEGVSREQCLSDGDQACVYVIPKYDKTLPK
ncbi:MAG: transcriptional regulator [Nitrospirae bacterium]|nr:transcriptional regulator [Nitrospirota bacterium]MCL5422405.1 transcriptional regulator [Nitrospirota bacterium]